MDHRDQQLDHRLWGVELAALASLGQRELGQEVLVNLAQHIGGPGLGATHPDVADQIDDLAQGDLVQRGPGIVFGQHAGQCAVVPLHGEHGAVDDLSDLGLTSLGLDLRPPGLGRYPEHVLGRVLVLLLRVGALGFLQGHQLRVQLLEGVGYVLQEDQAQHDVLVLGGVHAAAEGVGHTPQIGPVVGNGAVAAVSVGCGGLATAPGICFRLNHACLGVKEC